MMNTFGRMKEKSRAIVGSVKMAAKGGMHICGCCKKRFPTEAKYANHKCPRNGWLTPTDPAFATRRR